MKKLISAYIFALSSITLFPLTSHANETIAMADQWYERSFEQLLKTKIVTSTREEQDIQLSPNTISVYTAADIKRMGIRSIKELLDRTTGFFVNRQLAGPVIGSRGFIGDNEQFLLLIDGHSANSIVDKGAGNFFLFPFLEHIERVEILRGPGSTLWGSDAALGIIHIITKKGADIDGITAMHSVSSADNFQYANVQAGKAITEDINYMFSVTTSESKGFGQGEAYLPKDGAWERFEDSSEVYFKAQIQDITVYARSADMRNARPGGSIADPIGFFPTAEAYTRRQHNYIDIQHKTDLTKILNLETRFFSDMIQGYQAQINPTISSGATIVEESASNKEQALGLEMIAKLQANAYHNVLIGLRAVQTEIDPVTNGVLFPATSSPSATANLRTMRVVPEAFDRNIAVFVEDDWKVHEDVNIIYGIRVDKNTLREDSTIVLPRFSLNWQANSDWSTQYSYTTGYIRPPVGIGFLQQEQYNTGLSAASGNIYGAQESEEVQNHDIRIGYNHDPFSIKWNLYRTSIDKSFNFLYEPDPLFEKVLFYINTNKIIIYGNELEFNYVPSETWNLYANLSYVMESRLDDQTGSAFGINYDLDNTLFGFSEGAFTGDGTIIGYPHKMWNLGVNVFFTDHISTNVHYRGWADIQSRHRIDSLTVGESDRSYGPEHFLDLNVRYNNIANTNLSIAMFIKNVLNNDDSEIAMLYFTQEWSERKRSIGMDMSYRF
jgi:outer membrane receptor protein involved in Fe transport